MKHISLEHRKDIAKRLNSLLADEFMLFTKLYKYHWNIVGMSFGPLHNLFEKQYRAIFERIDVIAERTRALGEIAIGTLHEFKEYTALSEKPGYNPDARQMVIDLVVDHESIIARLAQDINDTAAMNDLGTSDLLTGMLEDHSKEAWLLRAHIE